MKRYGLTYGLVAVIGLTMIAGILSLIFSNFIDLRPQAGQASQSNPVQSVQATPLPAKSQANYSPPRPEDAPQDIRDAVVLGYNIMTQTKQYAANYTGNEMNCSNCHFNGGISQGGKNGGISLVGVAAVYPKFRSRQNYAVDMVTRVNDCFVRSQNGKPLPPESKEMTAMLTYLQWISKGLPIYGEVSWLGLPAVKTQTPPDKNAGQQVYTSQCAACHSADGQGTSTAPAVWGDKSYNDGAGMANPATLASFALNNMPRGNPILTIDQAANVAAYVDSQPRPHFQK